MLQRRNPLRGGPVFAVDGDVGAIRDFFFDDDTWTIRYVVADTGTWLQGRRVLIPLSALHEPDWDQRRIPVRLTREQVRNSPDVETQRPVSRQAEAAACRGIVRRTRHASSELYGGDGRQIVVRRVACLVGLSACCSSVCYYLNMRPLSRPNDGVSLIDIHECHSLARSGAR